MNMKKFLAPTSRDALRLIRIEMGADAVILSNRKVDGGVEIMALAGSEFAQLTHEPRQPTPVPVRPAIVAQERIPVPAKAEPAISPISTLQQEQQGILSEIKFMRNMMQEQVDCLSWSDRQQRDPQRTRMLRGLLNAGFSAALTRQIVDKMPATANMEWVRRVLGNNLRIATKQEDLIVRGGVVALIGPTGVGKTTTTAKLAARAVVRYGADKVALLTTDSYRIGAHEQLRIYGKILGVAVHAVRDTEDLRLTLSGLKQKHLVLIDTIGMGQRDSRMAAQAEMFNATGVQRLLLLNATSSGDTLNDVVCMYNGAGVVGCIPTKLDEAVTFGTVLDVAMRHKLTLHYIANGQRVPEDLHEVNMEYLLHRAFKQSAKAAPFTLHELEFPALMAGVGAAPVMRGEYAT
ncbi:MAG: flagellar biosynthesis protein FlhF [Nitrosomonadales bacterium]|nr:flagellar biosynthesis protein FlhF [Nitrosomonadales bacterium]